LHEPVPKLVRPPAADRPVPQWDAAARAALDHPGGPLRVLGGPGTGKSTLVAHAVADRIVRAGVDPEEILVLTASRRAAADLRERITELLAGELRTVREPLVRTVHSYAFAVLRLQSSLHELPPPRLLSGPEQDVVVRELLAGDVEDGGRQWPPRLRPALGLSAFAAELRDLLLRAAERGLGPEDLIALGREHRRDEWVAAGRFFRGYEQVTLLRGVAGAGAPQATAPALDAAELVSAALLAMQTDAELLRRERGRVRHLLVDDAQHLDPQQARLIELLGAGARELVLLGDPDQTVFSFRGADPGLLTTGESPVLRLVTDHRMTPAVRSAVTGLAARLPGPAGSCTARRASAATAARSPCRCSGPPPGRPPGSPTGCAARTCSTVCRGRTWPCWSAPRRGRCRRCGEPCSRRAFRWRCPATSSRSPGRGRSCRC
jgi:superfamily I DNA/RNA helicase